LSASARFRIALFGAALGVLAPLQVQAQNPAAAEALFDEARSAMASGNYDLACARFRDSDKLDPALGTRLNLADCEEKRGRLATAWSIFHGVAEELAQGDDRKPIADARAKQLEARLPRLYLSLAAGAQPGLRVHVDGVELGEGSLSVALPMDPGTHELWVTSADGARRQKSSFILKEAETTRVALRLDDSAAQPTSPDTPASSASSRRTWGYAIGGVGAVGVLFGTVTGVAALNRKSSADSNCNDATRTCNEAGVAANEAGKTYRALSTLGFSVGLVGLAAGAYLLLTSPKASAPAHSSSPWRRAPLVTAELDWAARAGHVSVATRF
jgi:hypothetical protein